MNAFRWFYIEYDCLKVLITFYHVMVNMMFNPRWPPSIMLNIQNVSSQKYGQSTQTPSSVFDCLIVVSY